MRTLTPVLCLLAMACSLDEGGLGANLDSGTLPDQSTPDAVDPGDVGVPVDTGVPIDTGVDAPPPACDPNACPGERCENGVCSYYASCKDMRVDTTRQTGAHKLRDPKPTVFDAWCDMNTDGGGWTLVGRSAIAGSGGNFGWKKGTGNLGDDTKPYSLDTDLHSLVFTEALVGGSGIGKAWFGSLYKVVLPANFLTAFNNSAGPTVVSKIGGACATNSPGMFTNAGFTDAADQFYLRNNTSAGVYGLRPGGFVLAFGIADCPNAAYLDTLQGMIFVR